MKQRLTYLLPFVAIAALAMANGCGDDDDDYPTQGSGGASGKSGGGGKAGTGGAGTGGVSGTGGAGQGGAGAGGAGQGGGGAGGAGQGGAGQGGAGEGGGGAGGAGQGGTGGVPVVIPSDKCETAPVVPMPPNQLGQLVSGQTFGGASNDYEFTCKGNVANGVDLAFGIKTNGLGQMTVRTRNLDPNLNVAIIGAYACGSSLGDAVGCANQVGAGANEQFSYITKSGEDTLYLMVENESTNQVSDTQKFSLEGYFNLALTESAVDNCDKSSAAIILKSQNISSPEPDKDVLIIGSTATAKSDFPVPIGAGGAAGAAGAGGGGPAQTCAASAPNLDAANGKDQVIAITPEAKGSLFIIVTPLPGDTTFWPVVSGRGGTCGNTQNLGCNVGAVSGGQPTSILSFDVVPGQTYYAVVDSLNADASGQYLATASLLNQTGLTVRAEPLPGQTGERYVVRAADGSVVRVIERGRGR